MEDAELVLLTIPETAPICTIPYMVNVDLNGEFYQSRKAFMTVVPA